MTDTLPELPLRVQVTIEDDPPRTVNTIDYVRAKQKSLKEFGYGTLLITEVKEQLQHALAGHTMEQGLDVIGMFIKRDKPVVSE